MPSYPPQADPGAFIATTDVYDVQTIYEMDVSSQEFKEFLVRLRQSINNVALLLNIKDTGYYPLTEFICSQAFYADPALVSTSTKTPTLRQVFRKIIIFGALPNNGVKTIAHGITFGATFPVTFTRIYGTSTDPVGFTAIPIPYAGTVDIVELYVDNTNVVITTNFNATNYTVTNIVLEWIKE